MNEIKIFESEEFGQVRAVMIDDETYFVGKDVAEILGYTNTAKAIRDHVDNEDKLTERIVLSGQNREVIFINESGLYSLILKSKLPAAKKFKRWVTSEILPSIRKYGAYMTDETLEQALLSPDFLIKLAGELKKEKEQRMALEVKIETDKPKVLFADAVIGTDDSIPIGDFAKVLRQNGVKIGQNRLFAKLRELGWLIKSGASKNCPTQRGCESGYFEVEEKIFREWTGEQRLVMKTKITPKGQIYFIKKFISEKLMLSNKVTA